MTTTLPIRACLVPSGVLLLASCSQPVLYHTPFLTQAPASMHCEHDCVQVSADILHSHADLVEEAKRLRHELAHCHEDVSRRK